MWSGIVALAVICALLCLGACAGLAFIPAYLADRKGYSFSLFWLFGFFLLIPTIIVAAAIARRMPQAEGSARPVPPLPPSPQPVSNPPFPSAEQMERYGKLKEQGFISESEYEAKRQEYPGRGGQES